MWGRQIVQPVVVIEIVDDELFRGVVVGRADVDQRRCTAFGLQQTADPGHRHRGAGR
jgi:hypothetical protein